MNGYFQNQKSLGANVKVELDLTNYATKADLRNATGVDTSTFAKRTDLANQKFDEDKLDFDQLKNVPTNLSNLKTKVDQLDVDKLAPVPMDLIKLKDLVKYDVVDIYIYIYMHYVYNIYKIYYIYHALYFIYIYIYIYNATKNIYNAKTK